MAVDMEAMAPWHRLMMRVWSLSSLLRAAGVALPEGVGERGRFPVASAKNPTDRLFYGLTGFSRTH